MLMFSATWPDSVQELARRHCKRGEPIFIRVGGDKLAACRTIAQQVLVLGSNEEKFANLVLALKRARCEKRGSPTKCLVFCRTKAMVDEVVQKLQYEENMDVAALHADKTQTDRTSALNDFKDGQLSLLVCTGVMGRGHDIPRVKFVINYDLPEKIEDYVHRIGRTGRAGDKGYAMSFVTNKDHKIAPDLALVLKATGQQAPPELEEIAKGGAESDWTWDAWEKPSGGSGGGGEDGSQGGATDGWSGAGAGAASDYWNQPAGAGEQWNESVVTDVVDQSVSL
jgi:superfamily II DNA/RNA helicase